MTTANDVENMTIEQAKAFARKVISTPAWDRKLNQSVEYALNKKLNLPSGMLVYGTVEHFDQHIAEIEATMKQFYGR